MGHLRGWFADDWQKQIGRALNEMERAAAPGGVLAIFETLTTGGLTPAPPTPELAEYYAWLEGEHAFRREVLRTDYQFADVAEAAARTEFFFGPELAAKIRAQGWTRLPEWTGLCWRRPCPWRRDMSRRYGDGGFEPGCRGRFWRRISSTNGVQSAASSPRLTRT